MGKKTKVGKARKDKFYQLAKETGYRSRAAFKLLQLNRKFGFLQQSQVCIDLCAAPGGWMQVAKQNMPVSSIVIGVDLYPIRPIAGCMSLIEDITTDKCRKALVKELQTWKADVILHDGAPNVGRNWLHDAYQQICLTLMALKLSTELLRSGGWFVTKVFRSKDYNALLWVLMQLFRKVHATKPSASRKESAEIFVVCQGYLAPHRIDNRLLDPKYVFEELDLDNKKKNSLLHPEKQKRVKAEGYTATELSWRNDLSAEEFMKMDNGLAALQGIGSIIIDDPRIDDHPKTSNEIRECCKDLKVLGRKEIKSILNWWKVVREDLFKDKEHISKEITINEDHVEKPLTQEEIEDMEDEELQQRINELSAEEHQEMKRKRKKTLKAKTKLREKLNLKMVIKGDSGPQEEGEHDIFDLKTIQSEKELNEILDVNPDFIEEEIDPSEYPKLSKFKIYDKNDKKLDDDANYENDDTDIDEDIPSNDGSDDVNYAQEGLGFSDDDVSPDNNNNKKKVKKVHPGEHPLIKSSDFRDKDTRRKQRVQLWYEKENLQNIDSEDDEDYDLDLLADEYRSKGVTILGKKNMNTSEINGDYLHNGLTNQISMGKKAKRRNRYGNNTNEESSSESDIDSEDECAINPNDNKSAGNMAQLANNKRIRLSEEELALGALMIKGRKTRRDLLDGAWNRYAFNDENLPSWFVEDEKIHMKKPIPVPKELADEYERKVQELNVRPIKKVMEAKARKRRRVIKRLAKAKKQAEKVMENPDASSQEKIRQLSKIYKKTNDKKKEVTYVVAKKHQAGRRMRRPAGVKGRYKVVDPRQKKDKRALLVKTRGRKQNNKK